MNCQPSLKGTGGATLDSMRIADGEPIDVRELAFAAPARRAAVVAHDISAGRPSRARWLFALFVLEIAVSGGIYFRSRNTSQVIVVPAPSTEHTVIT